MKRLVLLLLVCHLAVGAAVAQTSAKADSKSVQPKPDPKKSRIEVKTQANQMAVGIMAAEAALTPAELAIAERVYVGKIPCELGVSVTIAADAKSPGYFNVAVKTFKFRMAPVETSTGAIRLEDPAGGAVWLQLANKSMMMNQKLGQRLADACSTPAQLAVAEALEKNPGQSILDTPVAEKVAVVGESAASAPAASHSAASGAIAKTAKPAVRIEKTAKK